MEGLNSRAAQLWVRGCSESSRFNVDETGCIFEL
jgi:hypothetical protein